MYVDEETQCMLMKMASRGISSRYLVSMLGFDRGQDPFEKERARLVSIHETEDGIRKMISGILA